MLTQAQLDANRANAQHSTGPRTEAGKQAVSQNARKHGLSSKFIPLSETERPQFEALETSLRAEINPKGALQEIVFRELVAAAWKRDIVHTLLFEASNSTRDLFSDEVSDRVRKLQRHKNDQDRAFNRALRQLNELQTTEMLRSTALHALQAQKPSLNPDTFPGLANYAKVAKQSRDCAAHNAQLSLQQIESEAEAVRRSVFDYCQNMLKQQPNA